MRVYDQSNAQEDNKIGERNEMYIDASGIKYHVISMLPPGADPGGPPGLPRWEALKAVNSLQGSLNGVLISSKKLLFGDPKTG